MEALEQVMGSHSSSSTGGDDDVDCHNNSPSLSPSPTHPTPTPNFKRKRTKRLRAFSATTFPSSSSTSSLEQLPASDPTTITTTTTTEEEEDMAHCLILLAQGRALHSSPPSGTHTPVAAAAEKFTSRKFTETVTTAGGKAGFYVYECKTCSKCFPSFQALGGHRASHKKPRMAVPVISTEFEVKKQAVAGTGDEDQDRHVDHVKAVAPLSSSSPPNNKARVHECSICGSEFSSGQALGGHMRRHRPIIAASGSGSSSNNNNNHHHHPHQTNNSNITGNVLSLDLNLPAPSDELNSTEVFRPMVFSSALVDCHY